VAVTALAGDLAGGLAAGAGGWRLGQAAGGWGGRLAAGCGPSTAVAARRSPIRVTAAPRPTRARPGSYATLNKFATSALGLTPLLDAKVSAG
jgi:hypothetical protein